MKTILRAFALTLVVAGAVASMYASKPSETIHAKLSAVPVPTCPPTDPNGCGLWGTPPPKTN